MTHPRTDAQRSRQLGAPWPPLPPPSPRLLCHSVDELLLHKRVHGEPVEPTRRVDADRDVALLDVPTRVVLERALLVERLATVARKGLGSRVRQHVAVELGAAKKPRVAQLADVVALPCKRWVSRRAIGPSLAHGGTGRAAGRRR